TDGAYTLSTADNLLTAAGTYHYVLKEVDTKKSGVTYDTKVYTITVTVTDNGHDQIVASVAGVPEGDANFTNTYKASATTASITAKKNLDGRALKDGEFSFTLAAKDGAPMPVGAKNGTLTVTNSGDTVSFGDITYDKAGTYTYTIEEVGGSLGGVTYDKSTKNVTVTVTDDGDGKLSAAVDGAAEAATFTNTYQAQETSAEISGTKTLNGGTLEKDAFRFQISATGENADITPMPTETTVSNDANGNFAFAPITYTEPGAYTYAVSEVVPTDAVNADGVTYAQATDEQKAAGGFAKNGVTYDTATHTATVEVTDDGVGSLHAAVTYDGTGALTFTNSKFEAHAALTFDKYYYGSDLNRAFQFELVAADDSWQPRGGGVQVDYDGAADIVDGGQAFTATMTNPAFDVQANKATVSLPDLTYYQAGTYRYLLFEANDAGSDVVDDASVYEITVTVDDTQRVTIQTARVTGDDMSAEPVEGAVFYNNLAVLSAFRAMCYVTGATQEQESVAHFMPKVRKDFDGSMTGGEFVFVMEDEAGNPVSTGTNDAAGNVALDKPAGAQDADGSAVLSFTEEGTYTYTIHEVTGSNPLIEYDEGTVEVTVKVTKDFRGALQAKTTYTRQGADGAVTRGNTFTNSTRAIDLRVQKNSKSDGAPLQGARYGLWQYNPNGQDVYLGNNVSDENGWITFRDVKVQTGTAYYFKEEAAPSGHLVNPYRDPYFALVPDQNNGYRLVYEGSAEFAAAVPSASAQH
ncbi:MAG: Spy0128 family protein, partial [Coriobacteriales bacterium]